MKRLLEEVFVTEGVPTYTFVQPTNFNEILVDIRHPGKPVIIEGQSGTGKTTTVKKILERLAGQISAKYLSARIAADVSAIDQLVTAPFTGTFVIDDFHRLSQPLQERLADLAKIAAEQPGASDERAKLVLIGINQLGSDLIQLVPDIAKRTGIHRINPGTQQTVSSLVRSGCTELNIDIPDTKSIYEESKGDYWLTQQLCQIICVVNDVLETKDNKQTMSFDVSDVRRRVVDKLKAGYYPAVKEFCRGRRFRPSNDPYFKVLRAVSEQNSSIVDLNELSNAIVDIRGSINNIKERRLMVLLQDKPICARYFYYNQQTKTFAIEDPALSYFLKHLDWDALRLDCGFRSSNRDFEYDFALSFAGENRDLARYVAEQLEVLDARVFFDEYFEANFLGKTWSGEFKKIFAESSRLVVCFLDKHHKEKIWPSFERECFLPRVPDGEVIPIYLDETVFVGIPQDIVGIKFNLDQNDPKWQDHAIDEIVFKLMERLG
jgi:hypothetical protein